MIPYDKIREHYRIKTPRIMQVSVITPARWVSPYSDQVEWPQIFTPIEWDAWQEIRSFGRIPLYPQYPVGNYFVDFGNPYIRIAVECDGAEFHKDKEKDQRRDEELARLGWRVFRISGAHCVKVMDMDPYEFEDMQERYNEWYKTTVNGLIKALAIYYIGWDYYEDYELGMAMRCLENRVSKIDGCGMPSFDPYAHLMRWKPES